MFRNNTRIVSFVLLAVVLLVSCTPSTVEPEVSEATLIAESKAPRVDKVVPFGEPEIRDLQPTSEVVSNCGGVTEPVVKHPSIEVGTSHSIEWTVGGTAGIGAEIGSDLMPARINLDAALEGSLARDLSNSIEHGNAWDLPAEPGYIMEYTLMWREIWQPGYIDVAFFDPQPDIIRIDVKYRTGVQSEIIGQTTTECDSGSENIVANVTTPIVTTVPQPTTTADLALTSDTDTPQVNEEEKPKVLGFRLCNRDAAGNTFVQTDSSTGKTRIQMLPSAQVFFISTDPSTITFSPGSSLQTIPLVIGKQVVIIGKGVPGLEWIELDPGFAYTACIFSLDQFARAKSEADNDMNIKKAGGGNSDYYFIDGQNMELIETYP